MITLALQLCKVACTREYLKQQIEKQIQVLIRQGKAKRVGNRVIFLYRYDSRERRWYRTIDYVRKVDPNVQDATTWVNYPVEILSIRESRTRVHRDKEQVIQGLLSGYDIWNVPCGGKIYIVTIRAGMQYSCKAGYRRV